MITTRKALLDRLTELQDTAQAAVKAAQALQEAVSALIREIPKGGPEVTAPGQHIYREPFHPPVDLTEPPHLLTVEELLELPDGAVVWEEFTCKGESSVERMVKTTFDDRLAHTLGISGPALVGAEVYVSISDHLLDLPDFRYWSSFPSVKLRLQTRWERGPGEGKAEE